MSQNNFEVDSRNDNASNQEEKNNEFSTILNYPKGDEKIPLLLEFSMTLTKIVVILVSVLVAGLSIVAKATWIAVISRTGLALLVLGILGWIFNWFLGKYFIEASFDELKEKQDLYQSRESETREAKVRAEIESDRVTRERREK
ncbi:MAG: hypothetical protein JEZ06_06100 [Anaerolineaceae bacterium]|nr:hypothetical protein [Anaerolineaceae bacterium]